MTGSGAQSASLLEDGCRHLRIELPPGGRALVLRHLDLVRDANRTVNLTRITEPAAMVRDHVLDALAMLRALDDAGLAPPPGAQLMDLGSGAGFPGIPIAIARPDLPVTLVESRGPKARFLQQAVSALSLGNVTVLPLRSRDIVHSRPEYAGRFAVVTARAVAKLARVLREVKAVVATGGLVVHFKGPALDEDERAAALAAASAHGFDPAGELPTLRDGRDRRFVIHRRR